MSTLILENSNEQANRRRARTFCAEFLSPGLRPKYVLGRNVYAECVAKLVDISGFIDDYTSEATYLGHPVLKTADVPRNALVLIAAGGKPLSARRRIGALGIQCLDYFAFYKYSGLALTPIVFNEAFAEDFHANEVEYEWIYGLLGDAASREIFKKLVNFRLSYELDYLSGFSSREEAQYFEEFLQLRRDDETFVDIGAYNGFTSLEFIRLCPGYRAVHVFEPEPLNYAACASSLRNHANVHLHPTGLSNRKAILKLDSLGSGSRISDKGTIAIAVDTLDDSLPRDAAPTLIKMDIEGAELPAIEGASRTIGTHHPRLAISVYHNAGDFWRVPRDIFAIRDDYSVCLRHYTESIYETVMFFLPRTRT